MQAYIYHERRDTTLRYTDLQQFASQLADMAREYETRRDDPVFLAYFPAFLRAKARQAIDLADHEREAVKVMMYGSGLYEKNRLVSGSGSCEMADQRA